MDNHAQTVEDSMRAPEFFFENIKRHYGHPTLFTLIDFPYDEYPEQFYRWLKENATENVVNELTLLHEIQKTRLLERTPNSQAYRFMMRHRFTLIKFVDCKEQERLGRFYEVGIKFVELDGRFGTFAKCHLTFDEDELMNGVLHQFSGKILKPWV